MVKFKTFKIPDLKGKDEEEVKDILGQIEQKAEQCKDRLEKESGKIWSDVQKTDKAYYIAYCRAGELASQAVKQAGEYYKMNVELTAGYMISTNWAGCH